MSAKIPDAVFQLQQARKENARLQKLVDNKISYANDMRIALNKQRAETAKWKRKYERLDAYVAGCLV